MENILKYAKKTVSQGSAAQITSGILHCPAQFAHFKERCEHMVDVRGIEEADKFDPFEKGCRM